MTMYFINKLLFVSDVTLDVYMCMYVLWNELEEVSWPGNLYEWFIRPTLFYILDGEQKAHVIHLRGGKYPSNIDPV